LDNVQWAFVKLRLLVDRADQLVYNISTILVADNLSTVSAPWMWQNNYCISNCTLEVAEHIVYSIWNFDI